MIIDKKQETATLAINVRNAEIITFRNIQTNIVTEMEVEDTGLNMYRCGIYSILTAPLATGQYTYAIGTEEGYCRVIDSSDEDISYATNNTNIVYDSNEHNTAEV